MNLEHGMSLVESMVKSFYSCHEVVVHGHFVYLDLSLVINQLLYTFQFSNWWRCLWWGPSCALAWTALSNGTCSEPSSWRGKLKEDAEATLQSDVMKRIQIPKVLSTSKTAFISLGSDKPQCSASTGNHLAIAPPRILMRSSWHGEWSRDFLR